MQPAEVLQRARSQLGKGLRYKLGCGGYHPADPLAARPTWRVPRGKILPVKAPWCDCSGFVSHCLGISRNLPIKGFYVHTDAIYYDAIDPRKQRLFVALGAVGGNRLPFAPVPGDLVVFPDRRDPQTGKVTQGHVAVIVGHASRTVIDCASGAQDGVAEHRAGSWWSRAVVVRFVG